MSSSSVKILLTGPPGCGKTTAVIRIVEWLDSHKAAGFYTHEIRIDGVRKGFGWKRLDGDLEAVIGTTGYQSYIHCYHHNDISYAGFPIPIGNHDTQIFSYCLGDINGDGSLEIMVLANHRPVTGLFRVYVVRLNGTALPAPRRRRSNYSAWRQRSPGAIKTRFRNGRSSGTIFRLAGQGQAAKCRR